VPVYNAEKYLKRCIDSLLCQTLQTIEILCVNDGSTDNTSAILDEYAQKDSRITVFNQENKGPGAARNTALDNAKGKYILFCDSDDTLEPDAAFECSEAIEKNNVDVVIFNSRFLEVDNIQSYRKNASGQYISRVLPKDAGILDRKKSCIILCHLTVWGVFFRYDLINHYNLRFTDSNIFEDAPFLLSYLMIIKSGYALNKSLHTYHIHRGSLTDVKYSLLTNFISLLSLLRDTFKFAIKIKKPFREIYAFYWFFGWIRSRFRRQA
jgi:glycosyltransferase involved in cell wall biosynthesis